MCLPISRLFWVSSLAYPNLLGTKGYVVDVQAYTSQNPACAIILFEKKYLLLAKFQHYK
jgi:hypothetical protein